MSARRHILLMWLAWSLIVVGFMYAAPLRVHPQRPDHALPWTAAETGADSLSNKPYLQDPALNPLVAWDSEFYLGIATGGYDEVGKIAPVTADGESHPKTYAYLPLYPYLMKLLRVPFVWLGGSDIGASAAAGVLVSLLGTLGGLFALYELARADLGEVGALRCAWMMLIFPASFHFAVVYSEGVFVGLAFGALALLRRKHWLGAALLAALATWTRSVGILLLLPLLTTWLIAFLRTPGGGTRFGLLSHPRRQLIPVLPLLFAPIVAYLAWRAAFGAEFDFVQTQWFDNRLLDLPATWQAWETALQEARTWPEARYTLYLSLSAVVLALGSVILEARRHPQLALFGGLALLIPLTSGVASVNSALRYVLVMPTLWILLGRMTAHPVVDRTWSLLSILLLGIQAFLFSTDLWSS